MTTEELKSYLQKAFITGSAKTIIVSGATLVLLPLIINTIGMARYGLVAMTMIFGSAVFLVDFGISKTITLLMGKTDSLIRKQEIIADCLFLSFVILLFCSLIVFWILFFNIPILGNNLEISQNLQYHIVLVGFVILCVLMLNNILVAILEAYLLMHYVNIGYGLSSITFHIILLLCGILFDDNYILVASPLLSYLIITLYYYVVIRKHTPLKIAKPNYERAKKLIPVSLKFLSLSVVSSSTIPINKYLMVVVTGNPVLVGVFDLSLKLSLIANSFLNSIAQPLFGVFSKAKQEVETIFKQAKKVSAIIFIMYVIGIITFYFVGPFITEILDSTHSQLLFEACLILIIGISFTSVSEPFNRAYMGLGLLKKALKYKLLIIFFNIPLYIIFHFLTPFNRITISYSIALFLTSVLIIYSGLAYSKRIK
jgi:O-antigen/teichoic acid export membrane protein